MELQIPPNQGKKLENLEKKDKKRIEKKLNEIDKKLDSGISPEKTIEKRLRGPLHPLLQQRVGKWRLWFKEDKNRDVLKLEAIKTKKEAEKYY